MIRAVLYLLLLLVTFNGTAQNSKSFDNEKWEDGRKKKHYDNFESKKIPDKADPPKIPTKGILNSLSMLKQIILVLVIAGVIILFLVVLVKNQTGGNYNKKLNTKLDVEIEQIEADLLNMDMPRLIEKAFHDKDYRRELRLYYLWSIQLLDSNNHLTWKKEKTNSGYVKELSGNNLHHSFSELTNEINKITYGEINIGISLYDKIKSDLVAITKLLDE